MTEAGVVCHSGHAVTQRCVLFEFSNTVKKGSRFFQ
jgi:hypothetical protein